MPEQDWRIANAARLHGCSFRLKNYYRRSEDWDHDHCAACWTRFMLADGCLTEGYAVTEEYPHGLDYEWVCKPCFEDLKDVMQWEVAR